MDTLDINQAATFLGIHVDTLQRRAASGIIPGAKPGRSWRFLREDLVIYLKSLYNASPQCHSTNAKAVTTGRSTCGTVGDELDAQLERQIKRLRSGS